MLFSRSAVLSLIALFCKNILAECECGYSVNATKDSEHAVFTDLLESDFLHLQNIKDDPDWVVQSYVTQAPDGNSYGKNASIANVETNPIANRHQYSGPGIKGPDPGLQLYVRPASPGSSVPVAEVVSARTDIMYGSFRIAMKYGSVPGTCGSMFFYFNDTNEIDLEFLSTLTPQQGSTAPVWLVLHSPAGSNFNQHQLPFLPQEGYHEYRFDWMPDRVSYYVDDMWMIDLTTGMPTVPGALHMFHWSNGDPNWSRGPPTQPAVQTVSYVKAYFNSTNPARQAAYNQRCHGFRPGDAVCEIPKLAGAPDPGRGEGEGEDSQTYFFSEHKDQVEGQRGFGTGGS